MELINSRGGLDGKVNGEGLSRGELYLTLDELRWVQLHVGPEYGFILSPVAPRPQKQRKSKGRSENESDERSTTRSGVSVANKRQRVCSLAGRSVLGSAMGGSEDRGNCASSEVSFEGKTTRLSSGNRAASSSHDSVSREVSGAHGTGASPSSAADLRNVRMIDFKTFCLGLLDKLGKIPGSRWFLQPVDPELDGVPDYFAVIENPMDFQTIREKLVQNMYKNPFGWQLDMRLVFYNALKYHKEGNAVREDALSLAIEFENRCKEITEVNPYHYGLLLEKKEAASASASASELEYMESLLGKLVAFNPGVLSRVYSLLQGSKEDSSCFSGDPHPAPDVILDVLKLRPKLVRDQMVLLFESILQIESRYQTSSQDGQLPEAASELSFPNGDVAMTPSSEEDSPEDMSVVRDDPDIDDEFDGSEDFQRVQTSESNSLGAPLQSDTYSNDDEQDEAYTSVTSEKEVLNSSFASSAFPIPPQESAWGEWKAKVIQNSTLTQRENAPKKSKREREAEQADAEI
ncbi:bromo domain-containing protein [Cryptosporidium canis]|nr:bromo domain-containing protein [Cryptosporidium canis]